VLQKLLPIVGGLLAAIACSGQATLLWKIDCDSCPKSSFLMGTVHSFSGEYLFEHNELSSLAYYVDAIATEGDRTMLKNKFMSDDSLISGVSLSTLLDSTDYNLVKQKFEAAYHISFSIVDKYYPHAIMDAISYSSSGDFNKAYHKAHPTDTLYHTFMDKMIQDIAIDRKIPLYGLESREEIYVLQYRDMPLKEQAQMLVYTLKANPSDIRYAMQDICFTDQSLDCMCSIIPGVNNYTRPGDSTMIYKRNLLWMEKIPALIQKQSVLIAVGSMHFCGKEGLVNLLMKKNYKLTPLKYK
jgi:uncharacterized protein